MTLYFDCLLTFLNLCSKVRRSNLTLTVFSCQGCRCGCDMKKCRNQPFLHPWRKCLPQSWTSCNLIVIKVFLSSASAQIFRSSLSVTCFSFIPKRPLRISTPLFTEESKRKRCLRSRSGRNQDAEGWTPYLSAVAIPAPSRPALSRRELLVLRTIYDAVPTCIHFPDGSLRSKVMRKLKGYQICMYLYLVHKQRRFRNTIGLNIFCIWIYLSVYSYR